MTHATQNKTKRNGRSFKLQSAAIVGKCLSHYKKILHQIVGLRYSVGEKTDESDGMKQVI